MEMPQENFLASTMDGSSAAEPDDDLYSVPQQKLMTIIGSISASASFVGSSLIIYVIFLERRTALRGVYHRIKLGLSIMDCTAALGTTLLGGWGVTQGSPNQVWASGSVGTCDALGFFVHLHMSTLLYSTALSIYFLLAIRFEKSDEWVSKRTRIEPVLHIVAVAFPVATGLAAVFMELMNPVQILPGWCWIQPNPPSCQYFPELVDCERGGNYQTLNRISNTGTALVGFLTVATNMCWIWWTVRTRERQFQHRFPNARLSGSNLSRESATNAFLYSGAFFITYLAPAIGVFVFSARLEEEIADNRIEYFWGWIFTKIFFPLQGLFNAVIYLRPRWQRVRNDLELSLVGKFFVMLNPESRHKYLRSRISTHNSATDRSVAPGDDTTKEPDPTHNSGTEGNDVVGEEVEKLDSQRAITNLQDGSDSFSTFGRN